MTDILSTVMSQLGPGAIQQLSQNLGASPDQTQSAVQAALPTLLTALANNAQDPQGAQALGSALERDHDGSVLNDVAGFLGNSGAAASMGSAILGHVLGAKQQPVQQGLGSATGLNANQSGQLLSMLAPLVLGALGQQKQQQGLDAGGLASVLAGQRQNAQAAQNSNPALSMLTSLLDSDGDGSALDEIAEKGLGMLGQMFKK